MTQTHAEPTSLLDRTLSLLEEKSPELTLVKIAEDTELDYSWLCKFSQGRIPNPGVNGVQTLHDYLDRQAATSAAKSRRRAS